MKCDESSNGEYLRLQFRAGAIPDFEFRADLEFLIKTEPGLAPKISKVPMWAAARLSSACHFKNLRSARHRPASGSHRAIGTEMPPRASGAHSFRAFRAHGGAADPGRSLRAVAQIKRPPAYTGPASRRDLCKVPPNRETRMVAVGIRSHRYAAFDGRVGFVHLPRVLEF